MSRRLWRNDRLHRSGGTLIRERNTSFEITSSVGHSVWLVDASSASVTATLPSVDKMDKHIIHVVMREDAVTNGKVTVNDSGASEVWTGYAKGDHVVVTASNGTIYILDEQVTVEGLLAKTANTNISSTATSKTFAADYSEEKDIGASYDAVTNHRWTAPFDCEIRFWQHLLGNAGRLQPVIYVNGSDLKDRTGMATPFISTTHNTEFSVTLTLSTNDTVEFYAYNADVGTIPVLGDAAKDESTAGWELLRRTR